MKLWKGYIFFLSFLPVHLCAQPNTTFIEGKVTEEEMQEDKPNALVGANVFWMGTTIGVTTDIKGYFKIKKKQGIQKLIVSHVGYQSDTINVDNKDFVLIELKSSIDLDEIDIIHRQKSTTISFTNPIKVEKLKEKELLKAACCNLSESFETNPSIDVSFTDAISGTRQIQMLGLSGPYIQITRENMPSIRGFAAISGLSLVPGIWIESIQLNKGTGSVVNGFESIAGQINFELHKPQTVDQLYLNVYGNEGGRIEANANYAYRFNDEKWSSVLLLHFKNNSVEHDKNNDGFRDHALSSSFIGLNRWRYFGKNGVRAQFSVKGIYTDKDGGQEKYWDVNNTQTNNYWGMGEVQKQLEGWMKIGKIYEEKPWKSIGLQLLGSVFKQNSYYGLNNYNTEQNTFYVNLLYKSALRKTNHKFRMGANLQYDNYFEKLNNDNYDRTEIVSGLFFEYIFNYFEKLNITTGIRSDLHNKYDVFITPRLHLRYAVSDKLVLRISTGMGHRTANIFSENNGLLKSSRQIKILESESNKPYGLKQESAWNYGLNITKYFQLNERNGIISLDFYRTNFNNQVVVDLDQNPQEVVFYDLKGKSFSNSLQIQIDYEIFNRFDTRLAYRWYDVKTTYNGTLLKKPLVAEHRAFLNLAYETINLWKFDYTINWQGKKRIPSTESNPPEYQLAKFSPDFFFINMQISKAWKKKFEIYAGVENLTNYKQRNPILASDKPFSPYFDSSLTYGPIFGRNTYLGIRYKIK